MAKRLVIVWLFALTIVLFSSIFIYADDDAQIQDDAQVQDDAQPQGDFFIKNVIINGENIVNYNLQYSIILYDDVMYFPLTPEMCEIVGVEAEMDWENNALKLMKSDPTRNNISDNSLKNDAQPLFLNEIPGAKVLAYEKETSYYVYDTLELVEKPEEFVGEIDLKGMPLLEKDSYIYIPLRAIADNESFDWDVYFDNYYGVCISTDGDIPANTYFNNGEALENRGLVNYIMHYNSTIAPSYGQQLVFLFKRAGEVYGIDPKLLMAVAHSESKFNTGAASRGGAVGMMQIMPATGARYGLTVEQLMTPKIAIDFGAMYISERIAAYDGDWTLGLSAYNQGSRKVNRGKSSDVYANKVIAVYDGIGNYLQANGYVL